MAGIDLAVGSLPEGFGCAGEPQRATWYPNWFSSTARLSSWTARGITNASATPSSSPTPFAGTVPVRDYFASLSPAA